MRKIQRAREMLHRYGFKYFLSVFANLLLRKIGLLDFILLSKEKIHLDAGELFNKTIAYGPFKGMVFSDEVWWGKHNILSQYLGEYERHVLDKLTELSTTYDHFIDIGAADGYYALGVLKSGMYSSSTCFEISEQGRRVISANAALNKLTNQISVLGEANSSEIKTLIERVGPSVILCDIEGAEFDLFNSEFFAAIKGCAVIIELHDGFIKDLSSSREVLINDAKRFFEVSFISRANPRANEFSELEFWDDDQRMLAFSEGRPVRMDWICLTPKRDQKDHN